MRYNPTFFCFFAVLVGFALQVNAIPTFRYSRRSEVTRLTATPDQLTNWLATTDANLTFIGLPTTERLSSNRRQLYTQSAMMIYCDATVGDSCGGACNVYNGPPICLQAPNTTCLMAIANVQTYGTNDCSGSFDTLFTCGDTMGNQFCFRPGTESILVPPIDI